MKTNCSSPLLRRPAACFAFPVYAAILALIWLGVGHGLLAQPETTFTRITTGPLVTDLGSGWAVIGDYNNDGYLDVFMGRWDAWGAPASLYHNNGDGTFRSITNSTFPLPFETNAFANAFFDCSDFDNDGRVDLFVFKGGNAPSQLYFNNGDGTFVPVPLATVDPWGVSVSDYDQDGLLDLYLTSNGPGETNRLYRNTGNRTFQPMTSAEVGAILGLVTAGGAAWADYDDDGWIDVCVPDDTPISQAQIYHNTGGGHFVAATNIVLPGGVYSLAWADFDNDGRLDLGLGVCCGTGRESVIYRNVGGGNFERASIGVTLRGTYGLSWADYDNDGFLDLFMIYGKANTASSLFRNNGNGTFTEITTGSLPNDPDTVGIWGGPVPWFDYDNDGFLEPLLCGQSETPAGVPLTYLYHNNGNSNAWLKVKLVGTVSNREGAGAKVRAKATFAGATRWQRRDITSGGESYNGSGPIVHFGLGDATNVETLRIEWPSGQVTELQNLPVRQTLIITEAPGLRATGAPHATLQLQLTAHPGMSVGMEVSSNIVDWLPWQILPQTNRTMTVTDPEAGQHPRRFYKARVQ